MDEHLMTVTEQRFRGRPAEPIGGTGDQDTRHLLATAQPASSIDTRAPSGSRLAASMAPSNSPMRTMPFQNGA
jgi:hypothetical protein